MKNCFYMEQVLVGLHHFVPRGGINSMKDKPQAMKF